MKRGKYALYNNRVMGLRVLGGNDRVRVIGNLENVVYDRLGYGPHLKRERLNVHSIWCETEVTYST